MNNSEQLMHNEIESKLSELNLQKGTREYKTIVVGSCGAGKSSLVSRYIRGCFNPTSSSTIGASFCTKVFKHSCGDIKLSIWDTAGQERYDALMPMYYRGSNIAIVVFDLTDEETFEKAKKWTGILEECKKDNLEEKNDMVIILVGNKSDMDQHLINYLCIEGKLFADEHKINFITTSAKTGSNIENIFKNGIIKQLELEKEFGKGNYKLGNTYPIFLGNDDIYRESNCDACS